LVCLPVIPGANLWRLEEKAKRGVVSKRGRVLEGAAEVVRLLKLKKEGKEVRRQRR
jgi:hypothetical protein